MKSYLAFILLNLLFINSQIAQNKQDILGVWEIYKVDIGEVTVDGQGSKISDKFANKFKGQKDSALSINLLLGSLNNLLGMEYSFKENDDLLQYNPSSRRMRKGKYSYYNFVIKAVMNNLVEEYKIISVDKKNLILEIRINDDTKAEVYLLNKT